MRFYFWRSINSIQVLLRTFPTRTKMSSKTSEIDADEIPPIQFDVYSFRKAPRTKYVKGVCVQSGRSVRAAKCKSTLIYAKEGVTDRGWFYAHTYPNNNRYSDKCTEQIKVGKACCGPSHICVRLLEHIIKRRGRALKMYVPTDVQGSDFSDSDD